MLYAQYTATHSRPDYSTQHIHCIHIDMCVRARNRIAHTNGNGRSFVRSLARSLVWPSTRYTVHRTLLYHNSVNIIIAAVCLYTVSVCDTEINRVQYWHFVYKNNNFFQFFAVWPFRCEISFRAIHSFGCWCTPIHTFMHSFHSVNGDSGFVFFFVSTLWSSGVLCFSGL